MKKILITLLLIVLALCVTSCDLLKRTSETPTDQTNKTEESRTQDPSGNATKEPPTSEQPTGEQPTGEQPENPPINPPEDLTELRTALAQLDNMKFVFHGKAVDASYPGDNLEWTTTYFNTPTAISWVGSSGLMRYLEFSESETRLVYQLEDNSYASTTAGNSADFDALLFDLEYDDLMLTGIDPTAFEFKNGVYTAKADRLQEIGAYIAGNYEGDTFSKVEITLTNGSVSKIDVAFRFTYPNGSDGCDYTYTMIVSEIGLQNITIPTVDQNPDNPTPDDPTPDDPDPSGVLTVSQVIDFTKNLPEGNVTSSVLEVRGVVTGIGNFTTYYKNVTITDGAYDLLIYTMNAAPGEGQIQVGDTIVARGYVKNYYGTIEMATANGTYVELVRIESNSGSPDDPETPTPGTTDPFVPDNAERLADAAEKKGVTVGLPSTGDVNVLVIPISFTNRSLPENWKQTLEIGFNGTSEQTGWESLNSYYKKTSYGALNLQATILDVYNSGMKFNPGENTENALDEQLLSAAIGYYDDKIDYTKFDANSDGAIDCVYLIYLAEYNAESDDALWWAFTNQQTSIRNQYDGKSLDFYILMSIDFFTDPIISTNDYGAHGTVYVTVNCETVIHETGHALGLDDYYDYDDTVGPKGGAGGGMMMDFNCGDHDVFSKILMGWVTPTVVIDKDYTADLQAFGESGDAVIIAKSWNNSYYTEYYAIEFYTPTGLNEMKAGVNGLPSIMGIRIFHVCATMTSKRVETVYDMTVNNNTDSSTKLITPVEADGNNGIARNGYSEDSDLFTQGKSWTPKWSNGKACGFTLTVNAITSSCATITIDF